jgi:hypothetical protein
MEDLEEDTAYFLLKSNLTETLEHDNHLNMSKNKKSNVKEKQFWDRVNWKLAEQIYNLYYKPDFDMFNYSMQEYGERIKL